MHILAAGIDYRSAPVELREKFSFSEQSLPEALVQLKQTTSVLECVIVSTCNRTEIYAVVDRLHVCGHYIRSFMANWFHIPAEHFSDCLKIYEDQAAIDHLFRVACGLDSMIIGETQILGQVRSAFFKAQELKTTGTLFNTLFKQAITVAKKAHSETLIGENAVSVSYAAVELGKRIFGTFHKKHVMIIGAGKMSELTAKHLHAGGVSTVVVANRTLQKAGELADKLSGVACSIEQVESVLIERDIDIVISSTGADGFVLGRGQMERVMKARRSKPLFMIDIAVPRDLDPAIAELDNVFLYDIDDLQGIVESNLEIRKKEAEKVEAMIRREMDAFLQWYKTLGVSPLIRALQEKADRVHHDTMNSMLQKLPELSEREIKVIRKLSKSMINQMMHDPIMRIKEMAAEHHGDEALQLFGELFALEDLQLSDNLDQDTMLQDKHADHGQKTPAAVKPKPAVQTLLAHS